ncbi:hypothetical protein [Chromatocurvus halotolerans]|nr:hypothetical protein [Chromatocurvus halotolerans]
MLKTITVNNGGMRRAFLAALLLSAAAFTHATHAKPPGNLSVAACARDITPVSEGLAEAYEDRFGETPALNHSDPIYMAGFGTGREATDYNDRLWARGVVVKGRGGTLALVSLDLIGYFNNQVDIVREMVEGIDYLVVHSSHQHEGPDTLGIWGPDPTTSGVDPLYLDFVNDAIADCITEASASLVAARVKAGTITTEGLSLGISVDDDGFGVADQVVLKDDHLLAPDTNGRIVDPNLVVLQFTERARKKNVIATVVNFASHPEVLWSANTVLTSDFPHYVRERLEQEYGGTAIWVSGALGALQGPDRIDVSEDGINPVIERSFDFARVHGNQLAERAIAALDRKPGHPAPVIAYSQQKPVAVPLENPYFRFFFATGVLGNGRTLVTDGQPDTSIGFPFPPPFDVIPQALGEGLETEVGVARIGDVGLIVVPTELDPQIGRRYRAALESVEHKLIVGLGNDEIGYQVPSEKFDPSCNQCAPFILAGVPEFCPVVNPDCGTVFQNNIGSQLDPLISDALMESIGDINKVKP